MRRLLGLLAVLLLAVPFVLAGPAQNITLPEQNSTVPCIIPVMQDFTSLYHWDSGSGVARNQDYPTYEYTYTGDPIHFWAKIQDKTIYNLEHENVTVQITCPNPAQSRNVQLTFVTGIGAVYEPSTGLYNGEFQGDFMTPSATEMQGLCTLSVVACNPTRGCVKDNLKGDTQVVESVQSCDLGTTWVPQAASNNPTNQNGLKYQNVNDLLVNPVITLSAGNSGLSFVLQPNNYNRATTYPVQVTINSEDDTEGQGVIGNFSIAVTDLVGTTGAPFPTVPYPGWTAGRDVIKASNIRMKTMLPVAGLGVWRNLYGNPVLSAPMNQTECDMFNTGNETHTCYTVVDQEVSTSGISGYNNQLFFELYFDSNHWDTSFRGGALGIRYSIY